MPKYVGNLHEKGRPDLNLGSYSFVSVDGKEAAITRLVASATETMEIDAIGSATLLMTEDERGIGSRDLANPKHAQRP
jgi:hypothetical protein